MTTVLKFLTTNKADTNTSLAPTLAVVKELLSDVGGSTGQTLNVQVKYTGDDEGYILIGQGENTVIIQFGYIKITHSTGEAQYTATFPIAFRKKCFGIFYSHINPRSDKWLASVQTKKLDITSVTISEVIGTQNSRRIVIYLAIGV